MSVAQTINQWSKAVPAWPLYVLGFVPAAWWIYLAVTNQFGAEPAIRLEHKLGLFALQLLLGSLLITPLRDWFKVNLIKYRRAIGLMAFYYVILHLAVYLFLDHQIQWIGWDAVIKDVTKRPYIMLGFLSLLVMVPLALTSNNWMIRKIGPFRWRMIHKATYLIVLAGAAHFVMLKKTWQLEPILYFVLAFGLVAYRFWPKNGLRWLGRRNQTA
ncbi:MAG: protein-methionine-sulfoxide reductase heme-binding subunit MsrQ [Pseudomonadota bacterium]